MSEKKQTTSKARRPADRSARYWNVRHPRNMIRRAVRVFVYWRQRGDDMHALAQAEACAKAHGPAVEAGLARYVRSLPGGRT